MSPRFFMAALTLSLAASSLSSALAATAPSPAPTIEVAYPPNNYKVAYTHVIFEGHVTPGATFSVNGRPIAVGPDGLFTEWLPLNNGLNALQLSSNLGGARAAQTLNITVTLPQALPVVPTALLGNTLTPHLAFTAFTRVEAPARTFTVRFQGSPGGRASVTVGPLGPLAMREEAASTRPPQASGWYSAVVTLPEQLTLSSAPVTVSLTGKDGRTLRAVAAGRVSSSPLSSAQVAEVLGPDVGLGVNPASNSLSTGEGPTQQLFPRQGQRLSVLSDTGSEFMVQGPSGLAYAEHRDVKMLPSTTPLPSAIYLAPHISDAGEEWQVRWPATQRTLFELSEGESSGRATLTWQLAGAQGEAGEWPAQSHAPAARWNGQGQLSLTLAQAQLWGYFVTYEPGAAVLHVRKAPTLDAQRPLLGRLILIDPGHGGSENGGAGSLGVPEKNIVLPIAQQVVALLRAQGADARLTRDQDVKVALYDRPLMAEQLGADLLVSIHANALPDGVDPRPSRGLEVHTYHPMAQGLARALLQSMTRAVPSLSLSTAGPGGLMVSNLALTRPTSQRSVLIEMAYLTNASDLRLLMSGPGREGLARGIAQGLIDDYAAQAAKAPSWAVPALPVPSPGLPSTPPIPATPPSTPLPLPAAPTTPVPAPPPSPDLSQP